MCKSFDVHGMLAALAKVERTTKVMKSLENMARGSD